MIRPKSLAAFAAQVPAASGSPAEPRPTGAALEAQIADLLDQLPEDFDEMEQGARASVAWRVARTIAGAQNHVALDEPLSAAPEASWEAHTPALTQGHAPSTPGWVRGLGEAVVGLVPTAETAVAYADACWECALRLGLDDEAGRLGVLSLLDSIESAEPGADPEWPTREAIIALEDALTLHALQLATVSPGDQDKSDSEVASTTKAERVFRENYGLTEPEVQGILAMARARALELLPSGEGGRAMTWASLEDGVRRSQQAMDLRSELSFRKLQAMVLGLTRGEGPENQAMEFMSVVKRVSARQDLESPRSVEALPAAKRRTEEVEAMVLEPAPEEDELDAEALREFDAENPV